MFIIIRKKVSGVRKYLCVKWLLKGLKSIPSLNQGLEEISVGEEVNKVV